MIQPGQWVILDGGTTALQVAWHLSPKLRPTIVTHSPNVAVALAEHSNIESSCGRAPVSPIEGQRR